jgi:tetratricopeptide (TPR) repeat protein
MAAHHLQEDKKKMDLDDLSNSAIDAIEAGQYDKAEELCQKLLRDYPDVFDGHERMAMLREAQGRFQEAAENYNKVLDMMQKKPKNVDQETIQYITELRDQALAQTKGK